MRNKKTISRFTATLLTLTLCLTMSLSVSAAEKETLNYNEVTSISEDQVQPRGSLSGYGSQATSGLIAGQFTFAVNGSWSPWAGCTVKFEGFPSGTGFSYVLTNVDTGTTMFSRSFTTTNYDIDDNNIPMVNVAPGNYRLTWTIASPKSGTIHCYVY